MRFVNHARQGLPAPPVQRGLGRVGGRRVPPAFGWWDASFSSRHPGSSCFLVLALSGGALLTEGMQSLQFSVEQRGLPACDPAALKDGHTRTLDAWVVFDHGEPPPGFPLVLGGGPIVGRRAGFLPERAS